MSSSLETEFAPPERADSESISQDAQLFMRSALLDHLTKTIPCILLILNRQRQVVYKNQSAPALHIPSSVEEIPGKRPGEIFNCIHARKSLAGCGTSEFCSECGITKAILQSQDEATTVVNECNISTVSGDIYEFRVWVSPFRYENRNFTVVSLLDIRDEKRRHALERTFFHDINNILSVIVGYSDLLEVSEYPGRSSMCAKKIQVAIEQLIGEIASHRGLLQAENGELSVSISNIQTLPLLNEVIKVFSENKNWEDRSIVVAEGSDEFEIATDRALLLRVLRNMVKNALEATSEIEEVRIACVSNEFSGIFSIHNPNCMPRSIQLRVFQRSFSTKGKGRGIGTYSMQLFGEKYLKGKVWFSTSEEEGTIFYISIPLVYPVS